MTNPRGERVQLEARDRAIVVLAIGCAVGLGAWNLKRTEDNHELAVINAEGQRHLENRVEKLENRP